ncbi:tyrosine-type recombinase/integrase [Rahnella aceris]
MIYAYIIHRIVFKDIVCNVMFGGIRYASPDFSDCVLQCVLQLGCEMASKDKLSDKKLKSLLGKAKEQQSMFADGNGLSVRVSKNGVISFVFFFRLGGRESSPVWMTLGRYPDMSLVMAREKRDQCRRWLADGRDPRVQNRIAIEQTLKPVTVKDALMYWVENYAKEHRVPECGHLWRFEKHIFPFIGHIPLSDCLTPEWISCFDRIKKKSPVVSGHTFADCKQALRFCRMRQYANSTALDSLRKVDMGSAPQKRDRVLTPEELKDVWTHLTIKDQWPFASVYMKSLMLLCLVFGCRQREVRESTWEDWDLENWLWKVPKGKSKNKIEIVRPVPAELRDWITNLHIVNKDKGYILGKKVYQTSASAHAQETCQRLGHFHWTLHDFRRTLATRLNDMGVDFYVVEQLLGHTMPGVMGIYNRSQYLDKKLDALNMWITYLNCLAGVHENVTVMTRKAV